MWSTTQSFRMRPVRRREFPENLKLVLDNPGEFPLLDVFICTADPYKEPPLGVVNTALSVMAYEYPTEKISVYVSDDGGSELTLFAFMEAAKFAAHWLPFCRKKKIEEGCPEAYFRSNYAYCSETENIKMKYEVMKQRIETTMEQGKVGYECVTSEEEREALSKWTDKFTRQDHPTVIQVLLESGQDKDRSGRMMPNLIYVSRQKSRASPHQFKAGALNTLLRVSAIMTNAPIVLTLDCDMYSNNPVTPQHVLCYLSDPSMDSKLGYIQFPQRFHGLNKNDIYASEFKTLFITNPAGMDGLAGPSYVGTGCFFRRRVFFGAHSSMVSPEIPELSPDHVVDKPIRSQEVLALAHRVAGCNYENESNWGSKVGFRYGSLVEDYYTGYRLQCEGWRSRFCQPDREAFLGDIPISLNDVLSQNKRWSIGLLEVGFSKYSPVTFGTVAMGPLMALSYAHYAFWAIWSVPITIYGFLPQLALLINLPIFPKVSDPWFILYAFLFLGAYTQDFIDFVLAGGTVQRWWNEQRMWLIRGVTSYLFGLVEFSFKCLGFSSLGFNLTSKVVDDEQGKKYEQGTFEFGVASPMFVPLTMVAMVNLFSFLRGIIEISSGRRSMEEWFIEMFIAGFVVVNCWPIYEAMVMRKDKGRIHTKTTIISTVLVYALYTVASFTLKIG
ncbi:hypothetical protein PVL29_001661 [Vitis rotundifolia]|nr:hypothetical protein PVL29_001661 [Vitis rotundifolia]